MSELPKTLTITIPPPKSTKYVCKHGHVFIEDGWRPGQLNISFKVGYGKNEVSAITDYLCIVCLVNSLNENFGLKKIIPCECGAAKLGYNSSTGHSDWCPAKG